MNSSFLVELMLQSLRDPRAGMHRVLGLNLNAQAIWLGLAVTLLISTILGYLHEAVTPTTLAQNGQPIVLPSPIVVVILTGLLLVILDIVIAFLGRNFGGTGSFYDILLADVWLKVFSIATQIIVIFIFAISPSLGGVLHSLSLLWLVWMGLNFISAAHGDMHLGKTLVVVILSGLPFALIFMALVVSPA